MVFVIAHLYIKLVRADEIFDCWKCSSFILRRKYRISALWFIAAQTDEREKDIYQI